MPPEKQEWQNLETLKQSNNNEEIQDILKLLSKLGDLNKVTKERIKDFAMKNWINLPEFSFEEWEDVKKQLYKLFAPYKNELHKEVASWYTSGQNVKFAESWWTSLPDVNFWNKLV